MNYVPGSPMTEEEFEQKLKAILADSPGFEPYVGLFGQTLTLDGEFRVEQLRKIIAVVDEYLVQKEMA